MGAMCGSWGRGSCAHALLVGHHAHMPLGRDVGGA